MSEKELKIKMQDIMNRMKAKREELDMSYQTLSEKVGISKSTLQRYETGYIKNMPVDKLEIISKALNVSPAYLMGWEESPAASDPLTSDQQQLNDIYTQLNSFNKKKSLTYSKNLLSTQQMEDDLVLNAAHAINPTEEEKKHADDIMNDDSFWE